MFRKKQEQRKYPIHNMIIVITIVIGMISISGIFAKYRSNNQKEAEMIAQNFHVSSNYLKTTNPTYQVSDWMNGIKIELYNYEEENTSLVASSDIKYKIILNSTNFDIEVKQGENIIQQTNGEYTFVQGKGVHQLLIKPKNNATISETMIKVDVEITSPFSKKLSATFEFSGKATMDYKLSREITNGDYYTLEIDTNHFSGTVSVTLPSGLIPDNTNEKMKNWSNSGGTFEAEKFSKYQLVLFNPEKKEYKIEDFKIE